ncbi:MAG: hypothetical protein JW863_20105 [Chitinispirillaceae bacterium]|nr:hypothetical protein [Chitinispirillaceae bacterium]
MPPLFSCLNNYRFTKLLLCPCLFAMVVLFSARTLQAHPTLFNSAGGSSTGGGAIFKTTRMKTNDTATLTIDLFCHLGNAVTERLCDGDPLGTGDKVSASYNAFLYGVAPVGSTPRLIVPTQKFSMETSDTFPYGSPTTSAGE